MKVKIEDSKVASKIKWKVKDKRFVALIDIMGFKDRISRDGSKKTYDVLKKLSAIIKNACNIEKENIRTVQFSDSTFIFTKDDTISAFGGLVRTVSKIVLGAVELGVPVRGAMAHGEIYVDKDNSLYFGQPIIDAHIMESSEVKYYGIVLHNSIDRKMRDFDLEQSDIPPYSIVKCPTPIESGCIKHSNVNWIYDIGESGRAEVLKQLDDIRCQVSGKPRKYIDNTENMFDAFKTYKDKVIKELNIE